MAFLRITSDQMNEFYNKLNSLRSTYGLTEVSPTTQHTQYSKVFASQWNDLVTNVKNTASYDDGTIKMNMTLTDDIQEVNKGQRIQQDTFDLMTNGINEMQQKCVNYSKGACKTYTTYNTTSNSTDSTNSYAGSTNSTNSRTSGNSTNKTSGNSTNKTSSNTTNVTTHNSTFTQSMKTSTNTTKSTYSNTSGNNINSTTSGYSTNSTYSNNRVNAGNSTNSTYSNRVD